MRVEAQGLQVALGAREVLAGIDFSAHAGEVTAVPARTREARPLVVPGPDG